MAPALYIIPRVVAVPYNQTYDFLGESAWDVTHSLVYMKSTSSLTFIPGFTTQEVCHRFMGKNWIFRAFWIWGWWIRGCASHSHMHTHIHICTYLKNYTWEVWLLKALPFFLISGTNHITLGTFAATEKGINVELIKR